MAWPLALPVAVNWQEQGGVARTGTGVTVGNACSGCCPASGSTGYAGGFDT